MDVIRRRPCCRTRRHCRRRRRRRLPQSGQTGPTALGYPVNRSYVATVTVLCRWAARSEADVFFLVSSIIAIMSKAIA